MSLRESFAETSCNQAKNIGSLEKETPYSVLGTERMQTRYRVSVLLTIRESSGKIMSIFLPKRFTLVFSDADIKSNNDMAIKVNLIYHGTCDQTSAYMLSLKESPPRYHDYSLRNEVLCDMLKVLKMYEVMLDIA
jgi:hypothetical protein